MDLTDTISGMNLVWTSLALAGGGLLAAYRLGLSIGRRPLEEQQRVLLADLAEKSRAVAELEGRAREQISSQLNQRPPDIPPESVQVWLREIAPADTALTTQRGKVPVLLIANLKGGVAKTMVAANLAAYFARRNNYPATQTLPNKRVLLIDLDYQGSLSRMAVRAMSGHQMPNAHVDTLFRPSISDAAALAACVPGGEQLPSLSFYPATYGFDDFETREQFAWLTNSAPDDVRFRLLRRLRSIDFEREFDLVIIDTGPRLTLGAVNAIVAASHLLIPTAPDARSIEAVTLFLRRISTMKRGRIGEESPTRLCPQLQVLGILPTLTSGGASHVALQNEATTRLREIVAADPDLRSLISPDRLWLKAELPRSQPLQKEAQETIPYLQTGAIRRIINEIGAEIEKRM
jgi:cellulose biosynthesis protein BcsQ